MTTVLTNTGNQTAGKVKDPFWYRTNASYLIGVTNADNNPNFGIQKITLNPGSQAQVNVGILYSGLLRTVIGNISFQIVLSKSGAPFVRTVSTAIDKEQGKYWEHIQLTPQVKAQILRHYEAVTAPAQPASVPAPGVDTKALLDTIAAMQAELALLRQGGQAPASTPPASAEVNELTEDEMPF